MRRIAIINQKGGVGKTTTAVNLGAALARLGRRVVVVDMDPQANASLNLGAELSPDEPSTYTILTQGGRIVDTLRGTSTPGLSILPAHLDLSGAELELASTIGRETVLRDALEDWEREEVARTGRPPSDVVFVDNPPSLGLLSVNGLAASTEVLIAVQTEFFALQGLGKLVEIVQLLRRKLNPDLEITGVLACLYDSRLRLAREVLGELRAHFPEQLFRRPIAQNVKLAETPSFSRTIFEYAPDSKGAEDYLTVAREFLEREGVDVDGDPRSLERSDALTTADPHREALSSFEIVPYAADEEEDDQPPAAPDVEPPTVGEVDVPRAEPTSDEPAESATEVAGAVESVTEVATAVQAEPKVAAEPQIIAQPEVIATPETIAEPEVAEVPIEIAVDQ
ncbi:MAG: AAA family ATPase, partial [Planctomycetota bacterium]